ncbi:hypothetical protein MKY98_23820 [Paenibacillus sp. FSL M8-0228]|jgi:vacuolar-type H+-ATPase subunit B/Vma2|uniref:hypothetical protein n=1 Tax=Paenibacillus TaxID=44249 RepID=UPI00083D0DCD|nr:hypothetical protein [Paenibacillus polymyxa]MBO3285301.1 hypothetical protein [Paenibacillus polymyxa]ODB60667.1 hypothetical protein A7311_09915 [Paenibacillus polymyxa]
MIAVQEYVTQLESVTKELIERIHQVSYTELSQYAEQREKISRKIISNQQKLTEADKKRIKQLSVFDEVILSKMESFKTEASEWLTKKGTIQGQQAAYNAKYTPDSLFFDRRN